MFTFFQFDRWAWFQKTLNMFYLVILRALKPYLDINSSTSDSTIMNYTLNALTALGSTQSKLDS